MKNSWPKNKVGGFTLVEAALSLAIGALVMMSLTTAFKVTRQSWKNTTAQSELYQHARIAMSRLSSELRFATLLTIATGGVIQFDTKVLLDDDSGTTEVIRYEILSNVMQRSVGAAGTKYQIAGDSAAGISVVSAAFVPMKRNAGGVLIPLVAGDPLSMAVAVEVTLTMNNAIPQSVDVKTLAYFRGK